MRQRSSVVIGHVRSAAARTTSWVMALYLNHPAGLDWLIALEFGRVDDGQPPGDWRPLSADVAYLHDGPTGPPLGFKVHGFSAFDPEDHDRLWGPPHFDAPALGLHDASAGEIILAARTFFDGEDSVNRRYFSLACASSGSEACAYWKLCLEAGDAMAHYGLGCALFHEEHFLPAYRHLRHYTEIAPVDPWNWLWYGKAAEAIGETGEARTAYLKASELDDEDLTDADERLLALE